MFIIDRDTRLNTFAIPKNLRTSVHQANGTCGVVSEVASSVHLARDIVSKQWNK